MRIDLHTHSDRSDGTDSPSALVRRAQQHGINVLALTDHDTTEGWQEAAEAADATGVTLIRGIEGSCRFAGYGVHLLGYLPAPRYPPLGGPASRGAGGGLRFRGRRRPLAGLPPRAALPAVGDRAAAGPRRPQRPPACDPGAVARYRYRHRCRRRTAGGGEHRGDGP